MSNDGGGLIEDQASAVGYWSKLSTGQASIPLSSPWVPGSASRAGGRAAVFSAAGGRSCWRPDGPAGTGRRRPSRRAARGLPGRDGWTRLRPHWPEPRVRCHESKAGTRRPGRCRSGREARDHRGPQCRPGMIHHLAEADLLVGQAPRLEDRFGGGGNPRLGVVQSLGERSSVKVPDGRRTRSSPGGGPHRPPRSYPPGKEWPGAASELFGRVPRQAIAANRTLGALSPRGADDRRVQPELPIRQVIRFRRGGRLAGQPTQSRPTSVRAETRTLRSASARPEARMS